ncbi:MAG: LysR family transcriptional regulator [Proteobacteria bacterium]|nr:LysR family transcriptional regulator [Pseudomonadota bacterium]
MRFDLADLRLFVAVADAGSITKGARRAGLALASASARIMGMEEEAKVALLARGRRGIAPTDAGLALLHHARGLLDRAEALRAAVGEHASGLNARVRLACNTAALTEFLPASLARFLAAHPRIDVEIEEAPSYTIPTLVAQGVADLGIAADSVDLGNLQTRPFRTDRLVAVVPPGDRLARRKNAMFADIAGRPFVALDTDAAISTYVGQYVARAGHKPRYRARLRDFDAVCRLVGAGVGVGIVPGTAARRCQRATRVAIVELGDAWMTRHLTLCARDFAGLPAAARALADGLKG